MTGSRLPSGSWNCYARPRYEGLVEADQEQNRSVVEWHSAEYTPLRQGYRYHRFFSVSIQIFTMGYTMYAAAIACSSHQLISEPSSMVIHLAESHSAAERVHPYADSGALQCEAFPDCTVRSCLNPPSYHTSVLNLSAVSACQKYGPATDVPCQLARCRDRSRFKRSLDFSPAHQYRILAACATCTGRHCSSDTAR